MKRYSERHYDVWRTIWHDGNGTHIDVLASHGRHIFYGSVFLPMVMFHVKVIHSCWYQGATRKKCTQVFRQNYKTSSKIANNNSAIASTRIKLTIPSTCARSGVRPRLSCSGSTVSWRVAGSLSEQNLLRSNETRSLSYERNKSSLSARIRLMITSSNLEIPSYTSSDPQQSGIWKQGKC